MEGGVCKGSEVVVVDEVWGREGVDDVLGSERVRACEVSK